MGPGLRRDDGGMCRALLLHLTRIMPLQHGDGLRIGLLQIDAPVFQLVERDAGVGDGAADIGSGRDHAEIAVEILHLRFTAARGAELVQQDYTLRFPWGATQAPGQLIFELPSIINKSWCPPLQTHRFVMVSRQARMLAFWAWIAVF